MAIIDCYIILTVFIASSTGYIIGESCRYDSDCFVEHSYCLRQEICECKENYIATSDLRFCVATVGAICDSKHDCSSLPNSICYEQNCLCDRGFVSDPHNMNCKPVSSGLLGICEFDLQCQHIMGDYAVCKHGQCECLPGYIFIGKCIKTRSLGEHCVNDTQCYRNSTYYRNSTACINNICKCKPGFHQTAAGDCVNAGVATRFEKIFLILTLVVSLYHMSNRSISIS